MSQPNVSVVKEEPVYPTEHLYDLDKMFDISGFTRQCERLFNDSSIKEFEKELDKKLKSKSSSADHTGHKITVLSTGATFSKSEQDSWKKSFLGWPNLKTEDVVERAILSESSSEDDEESSQKDDLQRLLCYHKLQQTARMKYYLNKQRYQKLDNFSVNLLDGGISNMEQPKMLKASPGKNFASLTQASFIGDPLDQSEDSQSRVDIAIAAAIASQEPNPPPSPTVSVKGKQRKRKITTSVTPNTGTCNIGPFSKKFGSYPTSQTKKNAPISDVIYESRDVVLQRAMHLADARKLAYCCAAVKSVKDFQQRPFLFHSYSLSKALGSLGKFGHNCLMLAYQNGLCNLPRKCVPEGFLPDFNVLIQALSSLPRIDNFDPLKVCVAPDLNAFLHGKLFATLPPPSKPINIATTAKIGVFITGQEQQHIDFIMNKCLHHCLPSIIESTSIQHLLNLTSYMCRRLALHAPNHRLFICMGTPALADSFVDFFSAILPCQRFVAWSHAYNANIASPLIQVTCINELSAAALPTHDDSGANSSSHHSKLHLIFLFHFTEVSAPRLPNVTCFLRDHLSSQFISVTPLMIGLSSEIAFFFANFDHHPNSGVLITHLYQTSSLLDYLTSSHPLLRGVPLSYDMREAPLLQLHIPMIVNALHNLIADSIRAVRFKFEALPAPPAPVSVAQTVAPTPAAGPVPPVAAVVTHTPPVLQRSDTHLVFPLTKEQIILLGRILHAFDPKCLADMKPLDLAKLYNRLQLCISHPYTVFWPAISSPFSMSHTRLSPLRVPKLCARFMDDLSAQRVDIEDRFLVSRESCDLPPQAYRLFMPKCKLDSDLPLCSINPRLITFSRARCHVLANPCLLDRPPTLSRLTRIYHESFDLACHHLFKRYLPNISSQSTSLVSSYWLNDYASNIRLKEYEISGKMLFLIRLLHKLVNQDRLSVAIFSHSRHTLMTLGTICHRLKLPYMDLTTSGSGSLENTGHPTIFLVDTKCHFKQNPQCPITTIIFYEPWFSHSQQALIQTLSVSPSGQDNAPPISYPIRVFWLLFTFPTATSPNNPPGPPTQIPPVLPDKLILNEPLILLNDGNEERLRTIIKNWLVVLHKEVESQNLPPLCKPFTDKWLVALPVSPFPPLV